MAESFTVTLTRYETGDRGWRRLHKLANQRRRNARDQAIALIQFALDRDSAGEDVELSQARLSALLEATDDELTPALA